MVTRLRNRKGRMTGLWAQSHGRKSERSVYGRSPDQKGLFRGDAVNPIARRSLRSRRS